MTPSPMASTPLEFNYRSQLTLSGLKNRPAATLPPLWAPQRTATFDYSPDFDLANLGTSEQSSQDSLPWTPNPGRQAEALESPADVLGYGGGAGGGKTDLLIGAAATRHRNSVIFRREKTQVRDIWERMLEICGPYGRSNENLLVVRDLPGERRVELAGAKNAADWRRYQGRAKDFHGFDEATEFLEQQVRTLLAWNRTTIVGQRCRAILGFNPPTTPEGQWIISYFGPWLDPQHPYPAEPGELRWFATLDHHDGRGARDTECHPGEFEWDGETVTPKSRTFIPALLDDNPYLVRTNYRAQLQGLPEPLRSQLLFGDMQVGTADDEWQVIPTDWVRQAQARWTNERPKMVGNKPLPCTRVGIDVSQGGSDYFVIYKRYGNWFGEPEKYPGTASPDAQVNSNRVLRSMALEAPNTPATIDSNGIGASTFFLLRPKLKDRICAFLGHMPATATDRSGTLEFANLRAQAYWTLREWLDPDSGFNLALPPSRELLADLTAPKWFRRSGKIQIESKEDIKARLGRSTDDGDALVNTLIEYTGVYPTSLELGR